MARLLVSVRSAEEARAAVLGGATIIDVKEPDRGALGRADPSVWAAVRAVVPRETAVSVALGELPEWPAERGDRPELTGFEYCKIGLSGAGRSWAEDWTHLRRRCGAGPRWVAVAYADWGRADAPDPELVLDEALAADDCAGVLVDTWDKGRPSPVDLTWGPWFERARRGLVTALAGKLDLAAVARLAALRPDIVAVRGAACRGGDRRSTVDPDLVAELATAAAAL